MSVHTFLLIMMPRGMMTVICNTTVFIIAWAFFGTSGGDSQISDQDVGSFQKIMAIVMAVGLVASLLFHYIVEEKPRRGVLEEMNEELLQRDFVQPMGVKDWFCEPQFYQVAGIYMSTRLFVHLSQSYLPLYLQKTLRLKSTYVAIIPLVMFSTGFLSSMMMKPLNRRAGRKVSYLLAAVLGLVTAIWVYFGYTEDETETQSEAFRTYGIFFVAIFFGAAGSAMLVTNLSLTAELIGNNTETSAFVFGVLSFVDKVTI